MCEKEIGWWIKWKAAGKKQKREQTILGAKNRKTASTNWLSAEQ